MVLSERDKGLRRVAARLWFYSKEIWRHKADSYRHGEIFTWLRYFPQWQKSLDSSPVSDRRPWLTYGAIEFLDSILCREMRVCEYGVGGSTLFFLDRVHEIVSIEHDAEWLSKLKVIVPVSNQWTLHVIPPSGIRSGTTKADSYASEHPGFGGFSFEEYARLIESYPDNFFDLVQVDGRARVPCMKHSIAKVKPNGFLVLDDAERARYAEAHFRLDALGWEKHDFFGPTPYQQGFQSTCIWRRTENPR